MRKEAHNTAKEALRGGELLHRLGALVGKMRAQSAKSNAKASAASQSPQQSSRGKEGC